MVAFTSGCGIDRQMDRPARLSLSQPTIHGLAVEPLHHQPSDRRVLGTADGLTWATGAQPYNAIARQMDIVTDGWTFDMPAASRCHTG